MELLQVFDDNKNMLDEYVERDKKLDLPQGKYFMIILLFIQNNEGKFLIQKTSKEKGSEYAVTGGHVTYKDDAITTCIKEVEEELGLTLSKDELEEIDVLKYDVGYAAVYYLKKDIDINTLTLQEEEVESISWMSVDEINNLINENKLRKGNIEAFNKVLEKKTIK